MVSKAGPVYSGHGVEDYTPRPTPPQQKNIYIFQLIFLLQYFAFFKLLLCWLVTEPALDFFNHSK